jgi:hypothetical protein
LTDQERRRVIHLFPLPIPPSRAGGADRRKGPGFRQHGMRLRPGHG